MSSTAPHAPEPAAGSASPAAAAGPSADSGVAAAAAAIPPASRSGDGHPWQERIAVVEDRVVHKRYCTLYDRVVQFTSTSGEAHTLNYDVAGHPQCNFSFAVAFPFHPATAEGPAQVSLVREYAQGPNQLQYCLPTGGFDPHRHAGLRECALAEMREEAMLVGGEVVALLPEEHGGQSELKWSRNLFKPFLFIDPRPDPSGHSARDAEEHTIEIVRKTIPELRVLMHSGQMMMPSIYTCYLSLEALAARKLI